MSAPLVAVVSLAHDPAGTSIPERSSPSQRLGRRVLRSGLLACATCFCVLVAFSAAAADEPVEEPVAHVAPGEALAAETVQDRLKQIDQSKNLDDETKTKIRELLQQTLKDLDAARQWAASAKRFQAKADTAPADLAKTKAALAELPQKPTIAIPEEGLAALEQALSQKASAIDAEKAVLAKLEAEPKLCADRRVAIPKLIVGIREELAKLDKQPPPATAAGAPSEIDVARQWSLAARRQALENERLSHESELKAYAERVELQPLSRELLARRIALAEQELTAWREAVNRQRGEEAKAQLDRAQAAAKAAAAAAAEKTVHPVIATLTERNAKWAERRQALAPLIEKTTNDLKNVKEQLSAIKDRFKRTEEKVDTVGRTYAIGMRLRKEREEMPDLHAHRKNIKDRQTVIGDCQLEWLETTDRHSQLSHPEAEARKYLQTARQYEYDGSQDELEDDIHKALETEKQYVGDLIVDLNTYFDRLIELDGDEQQLVTKANEYIKYIDERVLWIHSTSPFNLASFGHATEAATWFTRPNGWLRLGRSLLDDVQEHPLPALLAFVILVPLIANQRRLRRKTAEIGATAARTNCCSILPTFEALLLMALLSAVAPGILWYVSWRLGGWGSPSDLAEAVAAGLAYTAGIYLVLDLVQQMCRPDGLCESHFDWPTSSLKPVRHYARAAKYLALPFVFLTVTMASPAVDRWSDSLGRFSFVVAMLLATLLVQRALRYYGGICQAMLASHHEGPLNRSRFLWYPMVVSAPLLLAILAAAGYYYTAQQLAERMVTSAYIFVGLILARSLLLRWLLVNRRNLAMEQARQRRAAAAADVKPADELAVASDLPTPAAPNLDLATINVQTRQLVKYSLAMAGFLGISLVWLDVLPALRSLDVPLWHGADQAEPTGLGDLFLALLTFATTMVAARNTRGLLEMALLQRSSLDASFRYTVSVISRYVVILVGLLIGCHILGLTWGTVQWLVAAVS
ncbi:MAG: hypothetical protein JW888_02860, partial [Pirellulales bacterium]|nr:hypothetical protein [Pirellulales bacterium]